MSTTSSLYDWGWKTAQQVAAAGGPQAFMSGKTGGIGGMGGMGSMRPGFGAGGGSYSMSFSGSDKDRLMGGQAYSSGDFPDFMSEGAPVQGLKEFRKSLGQYFDPTALQAALADLQSQQLSGGKAAAAANARAMTNRAMLAGGRVGAGASAASGLMPLYSRQAEETLDMNKLRAAMQQNQAELSGRMLQTIAGLKSQDQSNRMNYAMQAAQLAQQRYSFGYQGGAGYSGGGYSSPSTQGLNIPQVITPGYVNNLGGGVIPMSVNGAQQFNRVQAGGTVSWPNYV